MAVRPRISVITPSYNQGAYIEETILSVLEQDYPNLEYIIIDGGSTDDSVDIIRKYEDRLAYWVSEPDAGQSEAINKGLQHSTGEIWAWMNSDDIYLPGALKTAVAWLMDHPQYGIVYGDCIWIDGQGREIDRPAIPDFDYRSFLRDCNDFIPSGSAFIRKRVSDTIGIMDVALHLIMDWDYWMRAGLACQIGHIPQPLSLYRYYPQAKTWNYSLRRGPEIADMYEHLFGREDLPLPIERLRPRALSNAYLTAAHYALLADDRQAFRRYLWQSIKCGPRGWRKTQLLMLLQAILGEQF